MTDVNVTNEANETNETVNVVLVRGGKNLFSALAKAQGAMNHAGKDGVNPHFRSKYATLSSVIDAVRKPFADNGLSYVQVTRQAERGVIVETILCHASGEWISGGEMYVPASKNDAHGFGSALTYARRYSLSAVAGVAADDDDANAAVQAQKSEGQARVSVAAARQGR